MESNLRVAKQTNMFANKVKMIRTQMKVADMTDSAVPFGKGFRKLVLELTNMPLFVPFIFHWKCAGKI
jgi:hypothetical protein